MTPESTRYYDQPAVVDRYASLRAKGLFEREERAVSEFFTAGDRVLRSIGQFLAKNVRYGRLGSRLLVDHDRHAETTAYYTDPLDQARQLRATGFQVVTLLGKSGWLSRYGGAALFYVAVCGSERDDGAER